MDVAAYWDEQAATFDDAADHGLRSAEVRAAWADRLLPRVPARATVADLGCGTGSLSVLLAEQGHRVLGIDVAPRMVSAARAKATAGGIAADFVVGDASRPPCGSGLFDVVLSRHVLWAMPDPDDALRRWSALLRPGGRLLLVEGRWWTGGGLTSVETTRLVLRHRGEAVVERLDDDPRLWGQPVDDERYLVVSTR